MFNEFDSRHWRYFYDGCDAISLITWFITYCNNYNYIIIRDPHENEMAHLTKLSFQIKYVRITCMVNTQMMIIEKIGAVPGTDTP